MTPDLPTITARLRWDGDRLMLGRVCVGWIANPPDGWVWSIDADEGNDDSGGFCSEPEARAALLAAAVAALMGGRGGWVTI